MLPQRSEASERPWLEVLLPMTCDTAVVVRPATLAAPMSTRYMLVPLPATNRYRPRLPLEMAPTEKNTLPAGDG